MAGPGLGRVITDGFYRSNYGKGLAGAVVVALVALLLELGAAALQRVLDPNPSRTAPARNDATSQGAPRLAQDADAVGG